MRPVFALLSGLLTCFVSCATTPVSATEAVSSTTAGARTARQSQPESPAQWFRDGAATAHDHGADKARARNIILFIGDGMSLPTVAAARIYEGQLKGQPGEENQLSFERFPYTALSKTYNTDSQTPDSAGTMTAMITGVKTRIGMLSVDQTAQYGNCSSASHATLATALEIAAAAGLSTGVVTTTRITHATPAGTYAHTPDREWESDSDLSAEAKSAGCVDIARQLEEFNVGHGIQVAMGGGRSNFLAAGAADPEYQEFPGNRLDGRDLIAEWQKRYPEGRYVWNAKQLAALDLAHTPRLLGLFEPDHMHFEHDRPGDRAGEPSLAEMTRAALAVLKQNKQGYFLMVEGGRIDHAHHAGNAFRALTDTVAFSDAIRAATEMTSDKDTLILVTADHSHTLSFAGYPVRGNPILGKVVGGSGEGATSGFARDASGLTYTTLSYANGPGYAGSSDQQPAGPKKFPHTVSGVQEATRRDNLENVDTQDPDYLQESTLSTTSETHGGDDVGVWARGPGAIAVRGTVEQNTLFHFMVQSAPLLRKELCRLGSCEKGVALKLPDSSKLRP